MNSSTLKIADSFLEETEIFQPLSDIFSQGRTVNLPEGNGY